MSASFTLSRNCVPPRLLPTKLNKEEKKDGRYLRREFSYSKFQQTMILPDNVDKEKIAAQVENGVLNINLPKFSAEEKQKNKKSIEVK